MNDREQRAMVERIDRVVGELQGIQADAEQLGAIGLIGNTNMALSYMLAAQSHMQASYQRTHRR